MMANAPHPFLPEIQRAYTPADLEPFGRDDLGPAFYERALQYAQFYWMAGFPAKSLLMLNRAMSSPMDGGSEVLARWPLPYLPMAWMLMSRPEGQFIGNPRRHWQHLATRMVEPNKDLRVWRAWACWYVAKEILPEADFPADWRQIREEGVVEPTRRLIRRELSRVSPADDVARWEAALDWAARQSHGAERPETLARFRRVGADELPAVQMLADEIWHSYYPGIISERQIRYMLAIWYDPATMAREMETRGTWFALVEVKGHGAVGYLSFEVLADGTTLFLNKLYLKEAMHGLGIGAAALEWVFARARELGCQAVRLRVNRNNTTAIRAYLRAGFRVTEEVCSDIGSGFVMDDYAMERATRAG